MALTKVHNRMVEGASVNIKDFGAVGDGVTDDTLAIQAAIDSLNEYRGGNVYVPVGTYKVTEILLNCTGARLHGESKRNSTLYYTGTGVAVTISAVSCSIDHIHITSLTPSTSLHLMSTNIGTGTGLTGILMNHVESQISHCTISYFNNATIKAHGIRTDGGIGFATTLENNEIRYCWGGITVEETVTDLTVRDNTILDVEKYGISIGWDWTAGAQTSFTGDNFRIINNLIENVNRNHNAGGGVGIGYAIFIARGAVFSIESNYIEDVYAESGYTAYGIYADGVTDGSYLLALNIDKNNIATGFSGTKVDVYIDNAWYGSGTGNHFGSGDGAVVLKVDARHFVFGVNYFTGAPSAPYTIESVNSRCWESISSTWQSHVDDVVKHSNSQVFLNQISQTVSTFTATDATPAVLGQRFKTAGTTAITDFDGGNLGQTIKILATDNITITNNASIIKLSGATNYDMTAGDTLTLTMYDAGVWQEDSRSVN